MMRRFDALLAFRSILFVVLIPGTVAGYVPVTILRSTGARLAGTLSIGDALAACLIVLGASILFRCVWDFFSAGRGTLAPFDPPKRLVVTGLYRYTRNPMYNGVLSVLAGEAWLFRSLALLKYAGLIFLMFHVWVIVYEEPSLESLFGEGFRRYRRAVPRWGFTARPYAMSQEAGNGT
jgi:protein-S-isoprenylcysteine O-methyltransferase Ste14